MDILGRNEDYFDDGLVESRREYISRKRKADLVKVVSKVLEEKLSDEERRVLIGMTVDKKTAEYFCREMNTNSSYVYRLRDKAEKKVREIMKYVLFYRNTCEDHTISPIEFRSTLALADAYLSDGKSIVHRLRKLMAKDCIDIDVLYHTPGLSRKSVDEIFYFHRLPNAKEILIFSDFFGASTDYLLKGDTKWNKN